jgi:hypothetical protein
MAAIAVAAASVPRPERPDTGARLEDVEGLLCRLPLGQRSVISKWYL